MFQLFVILNESLQDIFDKQWGNSCDLWECLSWSSNRGWSVVFQDKQKSFLDCCSNYSWALASQDLTVIYGLLLLQITQCLPSLSTW